MEQQYQHSEQKDSRLVEKTVYKFKPKKTSPRLMRFVGKTMPRNTHLQASETRQREHKIEDQTRELSQSRKFTFHRSYQSPNRKVFAKEERMDTYDDASL